MYYIFFPPEFSRYIAKCIVSKLIYTCIHSDFRRLAAIVFNISGSGFVFCIYLEMVIIFFVNIKASLSENYNKKEIRLLFSQLDSFINKKQNFFKYIYLLRKTKVHTSTNISYYREKLWFDQISSFQQTIEICEKC